MERGDTHGGRPVRLIAGAASSAPAGAGAWPPAGAPVVLSLRGLGKAYRHPLTLRRSGGLEDVSFEIARGETFGLLGPNGAGKTTTIKLLLGLLRPSSGTGSIFGHPLGSREARACLGFLPENPYFYDYLSAPEFLDLCGSLSGMDAGARRRRVCELLEELDLAEAGTRPLRKYSKGMLQRVGLAQALIADPELLVLDEPMSGLDPLGRRLVRDLVLRLKKRGKTILMSTHILPDVEHLCDRVGILNRGRLVRCLDLAELTSGVRGGAEIRLRGLPDVAGARWPGDPTIERGVDTALVRVADAALLNPLLTSLAASGAEILAVQRDQFRLEDVFLRLLEGRDVGEPDREAV
ncbi:MAG: ABC transporter ATP-binding protein [Candidatus Eisenbacteria bacterium]|nr:ABC transporter ATP-binding protein [Candidatus Eisenbacteria bacterium]